MISKNKISVKHILIYVWMVSIVDEILILIAVKIFTEIQMYMFCWRIVGRVWTKNTNKYLTF